MQDIFVDSIMSETVVSTSLDATLQDVTTLMRDNRCSCVVVTENDIPVGIVTEFDFIRLLASKGAREVFAAIRVSGIMSRPVVTITENTSLFDALVITTARKFRHLPVVDSDGKIKGIVTLVDLAQAHFHTFEKQREIIEQSITSRTRELVEANDKLKALSFVDALMGIGNRRAMEVDLDHSHAQAARYGRPYSVALFDFDFFKNYNDTYGHLAGDYALKTVAGTIAGRIRASDRVYRYGGEEVLLLLPETELDGAEILIDRVLNAVRGVAIPHSQSPYGIVTLSCGIVSFPVKGENCSTWSDVVAIADREMYRAKQTGRNRASSMRPKNLAENLRDSLLSLEPEPEPHFA
ncbi:phytochrome-like protein cph2 [Geobacter sp. OR-1]|uniref:GGDEF domain-containing protein n=1 Tax=Geobacter sp. OR-1 TaxID=1266765 RepID=UPI000543F0BC|nr:GGDEF domain-containing protein [Geobacter sp. OR-1]GAM08708.1 phytochrome-like protein cph2 [Geobacter sp. OR-1]